MWHALHQGSRFSWVNCSPRLWDCKSQFWHNGRGPSMSRILTPIWSQTCSIDPCLDSKLTMGRWLWPWVGCRHLSTFLRACRAYDHHFETMWNETYHWRHSTRGPTSVHSRQLTAATPVIQAQSWSFGWTPRPIARTQKRVYNADIVFPNREFIPTHRRITELKRLSLTIWINCLSSWTVVRLLRPPSLP